MKIHYYSTCSLERLATQAGLPIGKFEEILFSNFKLPFYFRVSYKPVMNKEDQSVVHDITSMLHFISLVEN